VPCWTRPEQPKTTTPPVADRVKLPGSATGQRGKQDQGGTAEPKLGVGGDVSGRPAGSDRPASAGRPGWQPAPGRGWRRPNVLLDSNRWTAGGLGSRLAPHTSSYAV
jgi:hypothetical protein